MQVFIWDDIKQLTGNYHSGGGAVAIADNLERAIELIKAESPAAQMDEQPVALVCPTDYAEERVFIFPDAGCC